MHFKWSRKESEVAGFFTFSHIRMMGYFRLGSLRANDCHAGLNNGPAGLEFPCSACTHLFFKDPAQDSSLQCQSIIPSQFFTLSDPKIQTYLEFLLFKRVLFGLLVSQGIPLFFHFFHLSVSDIMWLDKLLKSSN